MSQENKKRLALSVIFFIMAAVSLIYPTRFTIKYTKPDLLFVFLILITVLFEQKTIVFFTLLCAIVRDLTEFRFPGPYILVYAILIFLVYLAASFFYRPGILVCLTFILAFTFLHDVVWIILYNLYYILRFGTGTDISFGYNIINGTLIQSAQNIAAGSVMYFLIRIVKRRVLHEKI